ncbi:hypothetical protein CDAR_6141 [Caerostris darwini]|uniref:Uncharacterized protein n=1 Tax=Caerostris darwini TaxID=1538125 RepID=A0AAV4Q4H3_9ARAC|nr:hypothetical protein CDAR_6141 [Caerostris darwini]
MRRFLQASLQLQDKEVQGFSSWKGRSTLRTSLNGYTESQSGTLVSEWDYCRSIVLWCRKPSGQVGFNPRIP